VGVYTLDPIASDTEPGTLAQIGMVIERGTVHDLRYFVRHLAHESLHYGMLTRPTRFLQSRRSFLRRRHGRRQDVVARCTESLAEGLVEDLAGRGQFQVFLPVDPDPFD